MNLLEREDASSFFTGCIRTESTDNGTRLHRLTRKQVTHFDTNEAWGIRARCTAGVRLNLRSNTTSLRLIGRVLQGARAYAGFDVSVDAQWTSAFRVDTNDDPCEIELLTGTAPGVHTISVTFPQSAIVELEAIEVDDDADLSPAPAKNTKYLAIGDSITQGMDALGPAAAYPIQLADYLDAELLNLGVGGHIFDIDALDDYLPWQPDIVTVAYGTNDWNREITRADIGQIVDAYLNRLVEIVGDARLYVLTPLWRTNHTETKTGGTLLAFSSAIAEAARSFDRVSVIDGYTLVPHREDLFADGLHPNDEGFLHYALNLARHISPA